MGTQEILLLLLVGVIVFGSRKLPELARSMGSSIQEFKKAMHPADEPATPASSEKPSSPPSPPSEGGTSS